MKSNKLYFAFLILIVVLIIILLVFILADMRKVPLGAPNDYWDLVDTIEDNNVNIYVYSDIIDLQDDFRYTSITDPNKIKSSNLGRYPVIVIEMDKYHSEGYSKELLHDIISNAIVSCQHLIILNNDIVEEDFLKDFDDGWDTDSYFITITKNNCLGDVIYKSFSGERPSLEIMTYDLFDQIVRIIEDSEDR